MKRLLVLCSALGILSLSSCSVNIHGIGDNMSLDFVKKNSETQTVDIKGIEKIEIDIAVGDCNVIVGDSKEAVVKTDCEYKAINEKKAQKALENTKLRCETKGDTLHIDFIDSETGKKIENSNSVNIITDIEVTLPDDLKSFDISADVGDIKISGFSGDFDISSDVGDITAKNLTITDKSDFSTDVGDVDLSLGTIEKSEVNIKTSVGNISLDTQGKSYEENSSKKDVVAQKKEILIDGKCNVDMKTDVGDIKISK